MKVVRTPDERFDDLPGYDYAPHYLEDLPGFEGLRLHYVDEGPRDAAQTFLCLHGEPTWVYLYRKMIPVFRERAEHRIVAVDYFGFGRSDKPVEDAAYSFDFHRNTLLRAIERLDLRNVTLVCQDWGGIIGLTLPMEHPRRFERLIVMNTAITTAQVPPGPGFMAWKGYVASNPDFSIPELMRRAAPELTDVEAAAYDAPFPGPEHRAGVRAFPELVPIAPDMLGAETSRRAAKWLAHEWQGQTFMAVGAQDPVLGLPAMKFLQRTIRNCPEPLVLSDAGHFVQERGDIVARAALAAFEAG